MTSPFGNPSFGCWDCGSSPNAKVVAKQKHRRNARRRKCIVFFVVVVVLLIIVIIIWCYWWCCSQMSPAIVTTMLSCKVFFSSLSSLSSLHSSVDFFPPKSKQDKQQRKKWSVAIAIQKWMIFTFFPTEKAKKVDQMSKIFSFFLWNIFFFPLSRHFPPCPHNLTASKHALANTYNQKRAKSLRVRVYSRINFTSHASRSGSLYLKKRARWKFTKTNKKSFRSHVRRPRSNFTHKGEIDCSRSKAREDT